MFQRTGFWTRMGVFGLLLTSPFLGIVLRRGYGVFHLEMILLAGAEVAAAAILAAITGLRPLFPAAVILLITLLSANNVQRYIVPSARMTFVCASLVLLLSAAVWLLRNNFYKVLVIFIAGALLVDASEALLRLTPNKSPARVAASGRHNHIIHIVLDEMIGLAGVPEDCEGCSLAATRFKDMFRRDNVTTYPFAFSNYDYTAYSIPSFLYNKVLDRSVPEFTEGLVVRENAHFDRLVAKGYAIRVYAKESVSYLAPRGADYSTYSYPGNDMRRLSALTPSVLDRAELLASIFIRSDRVVRELWDRTLGRSHTLMLPATFAFETEDVLRRVQHDLASSDKNTLFFIHLMAPHYPYIYGKDGSILPSNEWLTEAKQTYFPGSEQAFRSRYEQYGDQMKVIQQRVAAFLERIKKTGQYESTTIVIHGDHGSRLRMRSQEPPGKPIGVCPLLYDYNSTPDSRDLINRFSTLLAIKLPGATAPKTVSERHSVLHFLREQFRWGTPSDDRNIDAVYLFKREGGQVAIPVNRIWGSSSPRPAG